MTAVAGFAAALRLGRRISRRRGTAVCCALFAGIVAHVLFVSDRLWLARLLPISDVAVLGNLLLVGMAGALAGIAWRTIPGHPIRRSALIVALLGAALYRTIVP